MGPVLYHGGIAGLRVGDLVVPSAPKLIDDCPICAAGGDANHMPDRVFATPVRIYGKYYASKWVGGWLYIVEPVGDLERSEADSIETYHAPAFLVTKVCERAVALTNSERRHLFRMWGEADKSVGFDKLEGYAERDAAARRLLARIGVA